MEIAFGENYKHSGIFSFGGVIMIFLAGVIAASIAGVLYSILTHYIPLVGIVNVIFAGGYGFIIGFAVYMAARMGKVRNAVLVIGAALACSVLGAYAAWVSYIYVATDCGLIVSPFYIWEIASEINKTGAWTIKGMTPSGIFLWLIWMSEALILIGLPIYILKGMYNDVFCEGCSQWVDSEEMNPRFALYGKAENLDKALKEQKYEVLDELVYAPKSNSRTQRYLKLVLNVCLDCRECCYLSVVRVVEVPGDKDDDVKTEEEEIVSRVKVPPQVVAKVQALADGDINKEKQSVKGTDEVDTGNNASAAE